MASGTVKNWTKKFGIYILLIFIVAAVSAGVTAVLVRMDHSTPGTVDMSGPADHDTSTSFASIIATAESGRAPMKVSFRAVDLSHAMFGAVTKYSWDFADGAKAEGLTGEHTYTGKGKYTVTLTIFYQDGTQQVARKTIEMK